MVDDAQIFQRVPAAFGKWNLVVNVVNARIVLGASLPLEKLYDFPSRCCWDPTRALLSLGAKPKHWDGQRD